MTSTIDKLYQLEFKDQSGNKIEINDELIEKLANDDFTLFPKETKLILSENYIYDLKFKDGSQLKLFRFPILCKFIKQNEKVKTIYSYEHFKLILKEENFMSPCYYSKFYNEIINIDLKEIEKSNVYTEKEIVIKEKEKEDYSKIEKLFDKLKGIYDKKYENKYTYEFISPNFNNYFKNKIQNLSEEFDYIYSFNRQSLERKVELFLQRNDSILYPICGPHGIGKSITSLIIHKSLFLKGFKGFYFNCKYYSSSEVKFENKRENLIKEYFYISKDKEDFKEFYKKIKETTDINSFIIIVKEFIEKENNNNYYIILDQFQKKYISNNILDNLLNVKIFLLSSINDFDVKQNLIIKYEEELKLNSLEKINLAKDSIKNIKYIYIENLIDNEYYKMPKYQNLIIEKISKTKNYCKEHFDHISYVLKKFNYIPKYFFGYLYCYDSINDLLFNEYSKIMKKLNIFLLTQKIDLKVIDDLKQKKALTQKDSTEIQTIEKKDFIEKIKYIPLKYINFIACQNGNYYFYYSFPYLKKIFEDFINYINSKNIYFNSKIGGDRGTQFERIVKFQLRVYKELLVDGFLQVDTLANMKLTKKYKIFDKKYINSKNNILLDQKDNNGKLYDFAIYKPQTNKLILLQSKYTINNDTVKLGKSYYTKSAENILKLFNKLIGKKKIKEVYILFISSFKFNYDKRHTIFENTLNNKRINCLFYSVQDDYYSYDFKNGIEEIQCKNSFMVYPDSTLYEEQKAFDYLDHKKKKKDSIKNEEVEDIWILKRKVNRNVDLNKLHEDIITFIKLKTTFKNDNIIKKLGKLIFFDKYNENFDFKINKKNEYLLIFSLNNNYTFDEGETLGLVYWEEGFNYILNFQKGQNYEDFDEFFKDFNIGFYYAIGEKNENIL